MSQLQVTKNAQKQQRKYFNKRNKSAMFKDTFENVPKSKYLRVDTVSHNQRPKSRQESKHNPRQHILVTLFEFSELATGGDERKSSSMLLKPSFGLKTGHKSKSQTAPKTNNKNSSQRKQRNNVQMHIRKCYKKTILA